MNKIKIIVGLLLSCTLLSSCDSRSNQSQKQENEYFSQKEAVVNEIEAVGDPTPSAKVNNLTTYYDKIEDLSNKMMEELNFYENSVRNYTVRNDDGEIENFAYAETALTGAWHSGREINLLLNEIKNENDIMANLQKIENRCYGCEDDCKEGITELNNNKYIDGGMREAWISVLKRLINYSSEIREQTEVIRNSL